jgi:phospholipase/carboxylesterase
MRERPLTLGELHAAAIGDPDASTVVVVLHGRDMSGADLAPFAHSLGVPAYFIFPDAPLATARGRSWWPVDAEARMRRISDGPMDLSAMDPAGRADARGQLAGLLAPFAERRCVLVGFSQGGMLAMDHVLHGGRADALVLLSSTRIAFADWQPRLVRLAGLPMLIAHGHADAELAFTAGEGLRDAALEGGAQVQWLPFEGGHEIPLVVWRGLRQFLRRLI